MLRVAILMPIIAIVGCSTGAQEAGSSSDAMTAGTEPPSDLCSAAQTIRDLDDEVSASGNEMILATTQDTALGEAAFQDLLAQIEGLLPQLSAAYDELRAAVPPELVADADLARSFTTDSVQILLDMDYTGDVESDFTSRIDPQTAMDATEAVLRLDELTRTECNVTLAG